jgi:hypothetical protein
MLKGLVCNGVLDVFDKVPVKAFGRSRKPTKTTVGNQPGSLLTSSSLDREAYGLTFRWRI